MNPSSSSPVAGSRSFSSRAFLAVTLLGLCSIIAFLAVLVAVAWLNPFAHDDTAGFKHALRAVLFTGLCLPLFLVWLAYRLRLRSWWWIGGGFLAVAPVLAYLAADDPTLRRPLNIEEIAPAFPGAEDSYRVLMRYAKGTPEAEAFKQIAWGFPPKTEELPAWLESNRAKIEAAWGELAPQRAWYDELNTFDRIGDLGEARHDAPIIAFGVHRSLVQTAAYRARLLALDGRGDEAIATVLPVLEVGRKLQVTARALVRAMISQVSRNLALDAVEFTLARTTVSPTTRARLLAALGSPGGEAGARRLVAIEYAYWTSGAITRYSLDNPTELPAVFRLPLKLVAPLLINPHRTINEVGDIMAELQDLAARRQPISSRKQDLAARRPLGVKNLGGTMIMVTMIPDYQRTVGAYWKFEDRSAALREKLSPP